MSNLRQQTPWFLLIRYKSWFKNFFFQQVIRNSLIVIKIFETGFKWYFKIILVVTFWKKMTRITNVKLIYIEFTYTDK